MLRKSLLSLVVALVALDGVPIFSASQAQAAAPGRQAPTKTLQQAKKKKHHHHRHHKKHHHKKKASASTAQKHHHKKHHHKHHHKKKAAPVAPVAAPGKPA